MGVSDMGEEWDRLKVLAVEEIEDLLATLPGPLRQRARALPVTLERRPSAALRRDGIAHDTLGLFIGTAFGAEAAVALPMPAQVILFLENLWEQAEQDEAVFKEEVRTTLLHELGHYLGLDEDDLYERGLE